MAGVVYSIVDASDGVWAKLERRPCGDLDDIFRAQYPRLVSLLTRITSDRGQAEELASEVFYRLSARPAMLRPRNNLEGWLYRTAVNLGLDALRTGSRRKRHEQAAGAEVWRLANGCDPLTDMLRRERQQRVQTVLAGLKPAYARLLLLRHAGLSYNELAQSLRINPASVGKSLARAMTEFEKLYRSSYGSER